MLSCLALVQVLGDGVVSGRLDEAVEERGDLGASLAAASVVIFLPMTTPLRSLAIGLLSSGRRPSLTKRSRPGQRFCMYVIAARIAAAARFTVQRLLSIHQLVQTGSDHSGQCHRQLSSNCLCFCLLVTSGIGGLCW